MYSKKGFYGIYIFGKLLCALYKIWYVRVYAVYGGQGCGWGNPAGFER